MTTNSEPQSESDPLLALSARLQEAVGSDKFEVECLRILKESQVLPIAVAHCFAFNPRTGESTITDQNGVVEQQGSPISKIIDTFSLELPQFKAAVEQSSEPVNLTSVQKKEEISRSTIFQQIIKPFGLADVLHLPLMQANTRFSMMAGSTRIINEADRRQGLLVQRHVVAAMRNHHWLTHAEANGRNIEAVSGRSVILSLNAAPTIATEDWSKVIRIFQPQLGPGAAFPREPMPALLDWIQAHCESYPLQATDLNRAEFALGADACHSVHVVFLGDRTQAHRLLLYVPVGVPESFGLSLREKEVLHWICLGKSNEMIAAILDISKYTVRNHVSNLLLKLHVETRSEAASMARGWYED
jgi:DNA-binding CsgD family transcriptional regulator